VEVEVTHFIDAGAQDAEGLYDYYYEGDNYTFSRGSDRVQVRIYTDQPGIAYFVGMPCTSLHESATAREAIQHLQRVGKSDFRCLAMNGQYESLSLAPPTSS
jgi:hypothetical protein